MVVRGGPGSGTRQPPLEERLGDLRRLIRQYDRAENTVFPSGEYHKGGEYGSDVNFPVSSDERNNPKFTGCIDRAA